MIYKSMNFVLTISPPQLDFFPVFRSVIAPFFLQFFIICLESGLDHFVVAAKNAGLVNFRF